jgi:hypothetical protein
LPENRPKVLLAGHWPFAGLIMFFSMVGGRVLIPRSRNSQSGRLKMSVECMETNPEDARAPLAQLLSAWQSEYAEIEEYVEQLVEELERVRGELQLRTRELQRREALLAERDEQLQARTEELGQLQAAFARQEARIEESLDELVRLRSEFLAPFADRLNLAASMSSTDSPEETGAGVEVPEDEQWEPDMEAALSQFEEIQHDALLDRVRRRRS